MPVEHSNPLLKHVGIVVTGLGAFTQTAGAFTLHSASRLSEPDPKELRMLGGALAIAGASAVAVGIPLWVLGSTAFESSPSDSATVVVGPGVLGLVGEL